MSGCAAALKHSVSNYGNANPICTISEKKWLIDGAWRIRKSGDHQGLWSEKSANSIDNVKIIFPISLRCEEVNKKAISPVG
ncbi:hypothetical protein [Burkholderia sp. Ac-20379]|uniref:hypothetical protein n=1 Tax=Burkholderia sp. Ac-20379 TaxID=2703900 RepID=UPI0019813A91|nr:hypothetical protein [Burkholderia sp. Ac-20379]MBN3723338.1 hypothetical protein [Burkholderia sp. Ac-20379]